MYLPYLMEKQCWRSKSFSLGLMFPGLTTWMNILKDKRPQPKHIRKITLETTEKKQKQISINVR